MTDKKLTDNEIIKALNYCCGNIKNNDDECQEDMCYQVCMPESRDEGIRWCRQWLMKDALDLINRLQAKFIKEQNKNSKLRNERNHLQAEIKRLKECPKCVYEYDGEITEYCVQGPCPNFKTVEQIKTEAYKEFAKLLRRQAFDKLYVSVDEINNLLKEMAGEDNAKEKE